jgi:hypothetical protein
VHLKSVKEEDRTTGEREAMTVVQKIVAQGQITVALAQKGKTVVPAQKVATSQIDLKIVDRDRITAALARKDRIVDQGQKIVVPVLKDRNARPAQRVATSQIDLKIVDRDPITVALVQKDRIADQDRIIADQGRITADQDRKDKIVDRDPKIKPLRAMVTVELPRPNKLKQV